MKQNAIYLSLLLCICVVSVQAQKTYLIDPKYPVHPIDEFLLVLKDSTQTLTLDQIILDTTLVFTPLSEIEGKLDRAAAYWAKVNLISNGPIEGWELHLEDRIYNAAGWGRGNGTVDIYCYKGIKQIWYKRTGSGYPKRTKDIKSGWNQNRITFAQSPGDTTTLYLRVTGNSFGYPPYFNVVLRAPAYTYWHPLFLPNPFVSKFIFGILFITFLYHFLLFLYLRQSIYLWFSIWLFVSLVAISLGVDFGFFQEFILPNFPQSYLPIWIISSNFIWFTFWFFGRSFVGTKDKYPILDKSILFLILLLIVESLVYLIVVLSFESNIFTENPWLHYFLLSIFTLMGFAVSVLLAFKRDPLARYFGVGAIFATLAPMIGGLWVQGIIRLPFDPFIWGIFLQIVAYSFGLAYRQRIMNNAFQKAQLDLVEAERTNAEMQRIKDLDELKSKFFANISHEFRTPLALIMGPLSQVKKFEDGQLLLKSESYEIIQRNTSRLQELVDQLLELSKIESGHIHLNLSRGGMIKFIQSIVHDFESLARQKEIQLASHFIAEPEDAHFDKDKLQKIVYNLLSNAFKFTPKGGRINFQLSFNEPRTHLFIEVSDTGKGIPNAELNKIFDRFYRVESNEQKGSGIGLALTHELVKVQNGNIKVESEVGKGTTFKITLPITLEHLPLGTLQNQENAGQKKKMGSIQAIETEVETENPKSERLPMALIVEDNEDLSTFISEIISPKFTVIKAFNGLDGEEMAIRHIPNIIISDVMMPKRDGYELCHRLKSNVKTSHIPIILLTAKAGQENKMQGLVKGADAYMTKPFQANELQVRMENLIQLRAKIWDQFQSVTGTVSPVLGLSSIDDQFLHLVQSTIQENLADELFSVEVLAKAVGFSRSQLHRKLKALINKSPNQLIREIRLTQAKTILENKAMTVSEAAYAVGYANLSYFSKSFKETFGYLPSEVK